MNPLETYLQELRAIRSSGAALKETSYYTPLANLLNEIGKALKPKVRCIINIQNRGAGNPDGGLFTTDQFQRASDAEPFAGQLPARGVIEVKSTSEDAWVVAKGAQVSRYWDKYRQVLVTNYRDFVLVGEDPEGRPVKLETYRLAPSEAAFWSATASPRKMAARQGQSFSEFLKRVMLHAAVLAAPEDLAWFLASYAREARFRLEQGEFPTLVGIRSALEEGLGLKFEGAKGEHFFRSTLVQTLFYGMFSAWVLWSKSHPPSDRKARFDWRMSAHHLRVPILRKLFYEVAEPGQLESMNLPEVLDWAGCTLSRVDRAGFFSTFEEGHAVQYFYEPFLEAFDPELRKELGVWYTPSEIVQYMVARVDTILREELQLPDGLADPCVYVLDPCCGTGAYLVEVLKKIAETLREKGGDALVGQDLKHAAMERIFGFEILPAPFVVSHLQLGLLLQHLGAPLSDKRSDRVGVFLTNSLTGWEPPKHPKQRLLFKEFEEERDAADDVKRDKPILVILGNPPYNGFHGVAVGEERDLSAAYRTTKRAPPPQGQGLNDLYVRFFRMAERRIVEKTGQGVVCFISNYSWLDGLSFTGMRERYLEAFDRIWIDNLHGDRIISEYSPDGQTSETVFATHGKSPGIKVGTAISLLAKRRGPPSSAQVLYRDMQQARAAERRAALLASLERRDEYERLSPAPDLGLPFKPRSVSEGYLSWPRLPQLFPLSFPGVKTSRDDVVVDIDRDRLVRRMEQYFDRGISHEEMRRIAPSAMQNGARFAAEPIRDALRRRGFLPKNVVRYLYRPFDVRWLYWEPETKLLDEKRTEYFSHVFRGNVWLTASQRNRRNFDPPLVSAQLCSLHIIEWSANCFPLWIRHDKTLLPTEGEKEGWMPNVTTEGKRYLSQTQAAFEDLFYHSIAALHAPAYNRDNSSALRQDWPRAPLPATRDALVASSTLGRQVAALLDSECPVRGLSSSPVRRELRTIAVISSASGKLDPDEGDLEVTAGWGHAGKGGVTMPAKGKAVERDYTRDELAAIHQGCMDLGLTPQQALELLGAKTLDVYLNGKAYWKNVPVRVWEYTIGGYQVIKKWLSYREKDLLDRSLTPEEARHITDTARRIAAILLLAPALDANYESVKRSCYQWESNGRVY